MTNLMGLILVVLGTFNSIAFGQETVDSLLRENSFSGQIMFLNENEGRSLREMKVTRNGNSLTFKVADEVKPLEFTVDLLQANIVQTGYPFGLPPHEKPRAILQTIEWRGLAINIGVEDIQIETIQLHVKPDDLLAQESTQFPPGFMPPVHRINFDMEGNFEVPIINGGLYSESEIKAGKMAEAHQTLSKNYKIMPLSCSGNVTN